MRTVLVGLALLLACAACTEHGQGGGLCMFRGESHPAGSQFPAGDGCNLCTCDASGEVACTGLACPDAAHFCMPAGGCAEGAACGSECCGAGEFCNIPLGADAGVCRCGSNAPCAGGDTCQGFGPDENGCGLLCCGLDTPCPQ